jgi:lipopolysaccharide biosynthesis protein
MPAAKLRREIARIGQKLVDVWSAPQERRRQRDRDRQFPRTLRVTAGGHPVAPKIAVLVLWQPNGVPASVLMTCQHLSAAGYAPMVVSNAALSDPDRARLAPLVWQMAERDNLGHDFGAYRDGILLLRHQGVAPQRLVLLNDSIWFPLAADDTLLPTLEGAAGADGFSGAAWMERPGKARSAHFQSYLVMFGPRALQSPAFLGFWSGYLVSSRRDSVLRRGEKGLSQAMAAAGLAAPSHRSAAGLARHAQTLPDAELTKALDYAALTDPARMAERATLLSTQGAPGFRPAALRFLSATLATAFFLETHPFLAARAFGLSFLKKRRDPTSTEARRQVLRAMAAGDLPEAQAVVLAELRQHDG